MPIAIFTPEVLTLRVIERRVDLARVRVRVRVRLTSRVRVRDRVTVTVRVGSGLGIGIKGRVRVRLRVRVRIRVRLRVRVRVRVRLGLRETVRAAVPRVYLVARAYVLAAVLRGLARVRDGQGWEKR